MPSLERLGYWLLPEDEGIETWLDLMGSRRDDYQPRFRYEFSHTVTKAKPLRLDEEQD